MTKKIIQKIVLGGVIFKDNKILILQRSEDEKIFPGLWELPSGKKELLESSKECLRREIEEETRLKNIEIIMPFAVFDYQIEKENEIKDSTQINFLIKLRGNENVKLSKEHQDFAWIEKKDIEKYKLSKNIKKVIQKAFELIERLNEKT